MKTSILFVALLFTIISCVNEDPGPLQEQTKEYSILDFERLEIGDALDVTVNQGNMFSISVNGDRRDIDDLEVNKVGNALRMKYHNKNHNDNRQYTTYVTITMPALKGVSFSGAVNSKVSGFATEGDFDISLSGASQLKISGSTTNLHAIVSGASELRAFDLETTTATVDASGASKIRVLATQQLNATASGASDVRYRGNPTVNVTTSGASTIGAD
ncbi:MAG: head GIN domain-containing protein [Bacteroidota bacterium]